MKGKKVVIMVRGDVFSFGLEVYFREWGFEPVLIARPDAARVPFFLREHQPALLVTDLLAWPGGPVPGELHAAPPPIPVILLVAHNQVSPVQHAALQGAPNYQVLPKPCPVAHLKRVVEGLLSVAIPADVPVEMVTPAWPAGMF